MPELKNEFYFINETILHVRNAGDPDQIESNGTTNIQYSGHNGEQDSQLDVSTFV